jgi:hypothetical protein
MWIGLVYLPVEETPPDCEGPYGIILAWERGRERPFTVGAPMTMIPRIADLLRQAADGATIDAPACCACGVQLELPPIGAVA